MSNIILVGGSGRSGTTILNKILAQHPDVAVTPPWRFMIDPDGVLNALDTITHCWSPYIADSVYKRLESLLNDVASPNLFGDVIDKAGLRKFMRRFGLGLLPRLAHLNASDFCHEFVPLKDQFLKDIKAFSYGADWVGTRFLEKHRMHYIKPDPEAFRQRCAGFYQDVVDATLNQHQAKWFVDRNTWNPLYFDKFLSLDQGIKLIHIHRDPRDVVASFCKQNWMPGDPIQAARIYVDMMNQWQRIKGAVSEASYLEVSLEALSENPQKQLQSICDFVHMTWDDRLLSIPLDKLNAGRWKKEIAENFHEELTEILGPSLMEYGR